MKRSLVICNIFCAAMSFVVASSWKLADTLILKSPGGIPFWVYGLGGAALSEIIFFTVLAVMKKGNNKDNDKN